jgi:3,4-dihydroxy-2-butanone 4-phosphate synthase
MALSSVPDIIEDIRRGRMVILMDDEDRENEGDLIIAAEAVTPEVINFFASEACGLICMPVTEERARQLQLPLMVRDNRSQHETNFTVSIDAAERKGPGISAVQRAHTVQVAVGAWRQCRGHHLTGAYLSPGGQARRRAAPRRTHGGRRRPRAHGRLQARGADRRDHERGRHDGTPPTAGGVRRAPRAAHGHDRGPDSPTAVSTSSPWNACQASRCIRSTVPSRCTASATASTIRCTSP